MSATHDERDKKKNPKKTRCQRPKNSKMTVTVSQTAVAHLRWLRNVLLVNKGEAGICIFKARQCQRGADETWIFKRKGKCNSEHVQMPGVLPLRPRSCVQIKTEFQMPSTKAQTVVWLDCTDCRIVTSSVYAARRVVLIRQKLPKNFQHNFSQCVAFSMDECNRARLPKKIFLLNLISWAQDQSTIQLFAYPLL